MTFFANKPYIKQLWFHLESSHFGKAPAKSWIKHYIWDTWKMKIINVCFFRMMERLNADLCHLLDIRSNFSLRMQSVRWVKHCQFCLSKDIALSCLAYIYSLVLILNIKILVDGDRTYYFTLYVCCGVSVLNLRNVLSSL